MPAPWEGLRLISAPAALGTRPGGWLVHGRGLSSCGPGTHRRRGQDAGSTPRWKGHCQVEHVSPAASSRALPDLDPGRRGCWAWTPGAWQGPQEVLDGTGPARAEERTQTGAVVLRPWDFFPLRSHHHLVFLCPPPPWGASSTSVPHHSPNIPCISLYAVCLSALYPKPQSLSSPQSRSCPHQHHRLQEPWAHACLPCLRANKPGIKPSGPSARPGGLRGKTQ